MCFHNPQSYANWNSIPNAVSFLPFVLSFSKMYKEKPLQVFKVNGSVGHHVTGASKN